MMEAFGEAGIDDGGYFALDNITLHPCIDCNTPGMYLYTWSYLIQKYNITSSFSCCSQIASAHKSSTGQLPVQESPIHSTSMHQHGTEGQLLCTNTLATASLTKSIRASLIEVVTHITSLDLVPPHKHIPTSRTHTHTHTQTQTFMY